MPFSDLIAILARFAADILVLILLYDFFSQPFRFYGMDPLTRFVWIAARKVCAPFETLSRRIVRHPERDLTPLFTAIIVVFLRGLIYAATAMGARPSLATIAIGLTLSFQELFTRLLIPWTLFLIYADIQLARHQDTFIGNVMVMILHDVAKRFIVMIRKLLPSYRPLYVFLALFVYLAIFEWVLIVITWLPLGDETLFDSFPRILRPEAADWMDRPWLFLPVVFFQLASTFLFGIFILLLMHMIAGFSGLDPYDRFSVILGLLVSPWVVFSRRFFGWARVGSIDFSVGILLLILFLLQGMIEGALRSSGM